METCKQIELFKAHADVANRHNGSSKRPKDKKGKGGGKGKSGGKGLSLH